jgi:hypothetical protein
VCEFNKTHTRIYGTFTSASKPLEGNIGLPQAELYIKFSITVLRREDNQIAILLLQPSFTHFDPRFILPPVAEFMLSVRQPYAGVDFIPKSVVYEFGYR